MKRINHILLLLAVYILAGCGDDFLKIRPLSDFTPESIYVDEAGFEAVLVNLRKNLRGDFYGETGSLACELISTDMAVSANKAANAIHNFDTQVLASGTGENYNFHEIWKRGYDQIRNSNVILTRIDDGEFTTEERKNQILAEAYFHRAYWYYRMVHLYGDIPFLNIEHVEPKIDFYTHSRKTILAKIIEDMKFAVEWLPESAVPGAVSRAAGNHLLTKIYLADSQYQAAVNAATAVIDGGKHSLMTERFGSVASDATKNVVWDLHQKENKSLASNLEGILVVQDRYGFPDAEVSGGTKTMRRYAPSWWNNYIRDPDGVLGMTDAQGNDFLIMVGRGVGYVRATSYHNFNIWDNTYDLRHDDEYNWLSTDKYVYNNPASAYYGQPVQIEYTNPIDTIHCWYPYPYYKFYVEDEENPLSPMGGHSDWYLYRLAETYLLRAEAYWWLNELGKAADDINKVRERAKATRISSSDVTLDYILDERARELFGEEFRKTELNRLSFMMADKGINGYNLTNFSTKNYWYDRVMEKNEFYKAGNIMWGTNIFKISSFHVLWPIPEDAISSNQGGVINQNPGYAGFENNIPPLEVIDDSQ